MKKPDALRDTLLCRSPWLNDDPTRLVILIENGQLRAIGDGTPDKDLSYEQRYTLSLTILDYPGNPSDIIVPVREWLNTHQPDLLKNPEWQKSGFAFTAEMIDSDIHDLTITMQLTESVNAKITDEAAEASEERYTVNVMDEVTRDKFEELFSPFPQPSGERPIKMVKVD